MLVAALRHRDALGRFCQMVVGSSATGSHIGIASPPMESIIPRPWAFSLPKRSPRDWAREHAQFRLRNAQPIAVFWREDQFQAIHDPLRLSHLERRK